MSQPTPYTRKYSATSHSTNYPTTPQPGVSMDAEWNAVKATLDDVLTNLALIQRDDGELANQSVTKDSLAAGLLAMLVATGVPRGEWATATAYAAQDLVDKDGITYIAVTAHTSGTFSTDLAADKWLAITGASPADDTIVNSMVRSSAAIDSAKLSFLQSGDDATARSVQAKLRESVSLTDSVALDGDGAGGGTDLAAILNGVIDDLSTAGGGKLRIPMSGTGVCRLDSQITLKAGVHVEADEGVIFDYTNASGSGTKTFDGASWVHAKGVMETGIAITGGASKGDRTITVPSNTYAEGDYIQVQSNRNSLAPSWETSTAYKVNDIVASGGSYYQSQVDHTSGTFATDLAAVKWVIISDFSLHTDILGAGSSGISFSYFCEWAQVASVAGDDVTLVSGLKYDYPSGNAPKAHRVTLANCSWTGGRFRGDSGICGLVAQWVRQQGVFKNVTCENEDVNAVVFRQCVDTSVDDFYWDTNDLTTGGGGILLGCGNLNCGANRPKSRNGLGHLFDVSVQLRTDATSGGFVTGPNIGWYCNGLRARGNWAPAFTTHDGSEGGVFSDCVTIACRRAANLRSRGTVLTGCHFIADPDTSSGTHIGVTVSRWANDLIVNGCQFEGFPIDFSIGNSAFNLGYSHILQGIQSRGCTDHSLVVGSSFSAGSRQGMLIDGYTIRDFDGTSYIEIGNNFDLVTLQSLTASGPCSSAGIDILDTATDVDLDSITIIDCGAAIPPVKLAGSSVATLGRFQEFGDVGDFSVASGASLRRSETVTTEVTIADDAVYSFTTDEEFGLIAFASGTTETRGLVSFRNPSGGAQCAIEVQPASVVEATTGALAGTTGTDGKLVWSAHTDGKVYIENRRGTSVTLQFVVLAGARI